MLRKLAIYLAVAAFFFIVGNAYRVTVNAETSIAGPGSCKKCHDHDEDYESLGKSPHSEKAMARHTASKDLCELCHGQGADHVRTDGKGKKGLIDYEKDEPASERSESCLACHENDRKLAYWDIGKHGKKNVACSDCHTIHKKKVFAKEYETCVKCHPKIKVQINKISRHPITEGKVNCSNCHNPHGSEGQKMINADSVNELCYTCHAEKRGPYLWEHTPVEENCLVCHTPHGSVHAGLTVQKIPTLCQSCHDWQSHPGALYTSENTFKGTSPLSQLFGRSCLNCHNAVHGSNAPVNPSSEYNSGRKYVR